MAGSRPDVKLGWLASAEAAWARQPEQHAAPGCLGWIPYPLPAFRVLLAAAIAAGHGPFVDLGCGIGTKVLAAAGQGLRGYGVEIVPAYVREAARLGAPVVVGDVRGWPVCRAGIVYLNHPLASDIDQALLEERVQAQMRPGSVLVQVNSVMLPGPGWEIIRIVGDGDVAAVKL